MANIYEGTWEEIKLLREKQLTGHKVLVVDLEQEMHADTTTVVPPFAVTDQERLVKMLLESVDAPTHDVTDETFLLLHERIDERARNAQR
jgi:hypothetical protein